MNRTTKICNQIFNAGVGIAQAGIMGSLLDGEKTSCEIASETGRRTENVSAQLSTLYRKELVERQVIPERRATKAYYLWRLSEKGKKLFWA